MEVKTAKPGNGPKSELIMTNSTLRLNTWQPNPRMKAKLSNIIVRKIACLRMLVGASSLAAEPDPAPKRFTAFVGGFLGPCYAVELRDGVLLHSATNTAEKVQFLKITPAPEQWREFRRSLDKLKVWQWRAEYPDPGVCDGTQWSLEIEFADRVLTSHGSNNFPSAGGKPSRTPEVTKEFAAYQTAVTRLLGGKEFQ